MITLQEILEFAKTKHACEAQLKAFKKFLKAKDELSAWQTVLGNVEWLRNQGLEIEQGFLEEKAQGVSKFWHSNGQLCSLASYKEGNLNGLYQSWYSIGQLQFLCTYKDGKKDGLYQIWRFDGQLYSSYIFKEDELIKKVS